jgi:tetratricopeptide (TPR) repeat protein
MIHPSSFILHPSLRARLVRWVIAISLPAALALGLAGWLWQRGPTPEPPAVPLEGAEPRVAQLIQAESAAVRQQPRSGPTWGRLGQVLRVHGFDQQAVTCWVQAERFDADEPRWPYYRGVVLLMLGDNKGLDALRRAATLADRFDSDNLTPRLTLAEQLLALAEEDEAAEVLQLVEQKQPRNPRLLFSRAVLAERAGHTRKAIQLFGRLTKHPCTRQRASARLASLYARLGQAGQAAEFGQRALQLSEDAGWPDRYWEELSSLDVSSHARFRELKQHEDEEADQAAYRHLVEMTEGEESQSASAHLALATTQFRLGQKEQAEKSLHRALALEPTSVRVLYTLGLVRFLQAEEHRTSGRDEGGKAAARYDEAIGFLRRALESKPNDALTHIFLGRALLARGRHKAAITALRVPLETRPEDFRSYLYLGIALMEDGQLAEARKHLERAAQLAPKDDPEPARALERLNQKEKSLQPGGK